METDDVHTRRARLKDQAATLLGADYFTMLGVSRGASAADVTAAFSEAAKKWHPDRVPPDLQDLAPLFTAVFTRLDEARRTLGDAARRLDYARELSRIQADTRGRSAPQGAPAPNAEAALEVRKAEVLLKKNDVATAEKHLRRAVQLAPEVVEFQARLVALVAAKPGAARERGDELIAELDRLVARDARCEIALFTRGLLKKQLGRADEAAADFERVVDVNPKHVDAQREVRLHTMRKGRAAEAPAESSGAIGRFFKKLTNRS